MARIKVPGADTQITVYDGTDPKLYRITNGVVVVDDAHVASLLASVSGSELLPEEPAKKEK